MNDVEMALVCFLNEYHRKEAYQYEQYQMLHGVKYQKEMSEEHFKLFRKKYRGNCYGTAYELKTYYMENGLLSNTIVLKMRPASSESQEMPNIKIHSDTDGRDNEYTHHAIEIFKEHGKYKVLDVLHRNKTMWLENYLDEVCRTNGCPREQLRYDMGYLAASHAFAGNMQELSDLLRYLDKQYKIGKPRLNLVNIPVTKDAGMLLSDDIIMNFDAIGKEFGCTGEEVILSYKRIYDRIMSIRISILHALCLGHIMHDPIIRCAMAESIFDDVKMCQMVSLGNLIGNDSKSGLSGKM